MTLLSLTMGHRHGAAKPVYNIVSESSAEWENHFLFGVDIEYIQRRGSNRVFIAGPGVRLCWAVAKLVRHQALDLAFEGSNPSRPAIDGTGILGTRGI